MRSLVLGSASPRRKELLESTGIRFRVVVADVDESQRAEESPNEYIARIVRAKRDSLLGKLTAGEVLLTADTVCVIDGMILGKPANSAAAKEMIGRMQGRAHVVDTRACLSTATEILWEDTVSTRVLFRPLSEAEQDAYVQTGEGLDKAGAYALQGRAAQFVLRIEGSYSNVVGLPLAEVAMQLKLAGVA